MNHHINSIQNGPKVFKCHFCDFNFERRKDFDTHKHNIHYKQIKEFACNVCGKKYTSQGHLSDHEKSIHMQLENTDIFKCDLCDTVFRTEALLKAHHIKIHIKIASKCPICDREVRSENHMKIHEHETPSTCDCCGKVFTSMELFERHKRDKNAPIKDVKCTICNKILSSKRARDDHVKNLHFVLTDNAKCTKCEKVFPSKKRLVAHISTSHSEKKYQCDFCEKTFFTKHTFNKHLKTIHLKQDSSNFKCIDCHKSFPTKKRLEIHVSYVHHNKKHTCQICKENVSSLWSHIQVHLKKGNFQCNTCEKTFSIQNRLNTHIKNIHSPKSDIFLCDICEKPFRLQKYLKNHYKFTHRKTREACKICEVIIPGSITRMKTHLNNVHFRNIISYDCHLCDKRFKSQRGQSLHFQKIHELHEIEMLQCDICEKDYPGKDALRRHFYENHRKKEKFTCEVCGKHLSSKNKLKLHSANRHNGIKFKCSQCDQEFTLQANLTAHVAVYHDPIKPYECEICAKQFAKKYLLTRHKNYKHK